MILTKCISLKPMDTNCYFLTDEKTGDMAVVDIGVPAGEVMEKVEENKDKIKYLIFTHRHCDHLLGAKRAKEITGAEILIHNLDKCGLTSTKDSLFSSMSHLYGFEQQFVQADILLEDGDEIKLGESVIKVILTPGHTEGSICLVYGDSMITGDLLFENSIGRTDFATGSFTELIKSIKKLQALGKDFTLYPGHYGKTTLSRELSFNPYIPR
ncbi:MAG: MBL fold metallo-hydrolase [Acutalibacteraceae bacterium]|nr:MBL fold metallo-hydrolase [Acutalibacteraceae bacterium]